jgi:hypothetical protein
VGAAGGGAAGWPTEARVVELERAGPGVRSHCRFRRRGSEYVRESGITRVCGGAKRPCDRARSSRDPTARSQRSSRPECCWLRSSFASRRPPSQPLGGGGLSSARTGTGTRPQPWAERGGASSNILVNNICPYKVRSAKRLKWSIVTRVHVPRQVRTGSAARSFSRRLRLRSALSPRSGGGTWRRRRRRRRALTKAAVSRARTHTVGYDALGVFGAIPQRTCVDENPNLLLESGPQNSERIAQGAARALTSERPMSSSPSWTTARAGSRRFCLVGALRPHTKVPYTTDLLWRTPRALKRPGRGGAAQLANASAKSARSAPTRPAW